MVIQRVRARDGRSPKRYSLSQCALYKVGSKARLAKVLRTTQAQLLALFQNDNNYKIFVIPAKDDPFSTPRKKRPAQEPKTELRRVHSRILRLLKGIEPPGYLHSAIKGRSYKTNAAAHLSKARVIKLDIRRFFPSTTETMAFIFFREVLCCSPDVARILARLTTWKGVLPTGSPLSPLLSYYANKAMFDDLSALAISRGLTFTCYVDDLTFSGENLSQGLANEIEEIILQHGHTVSTEKTRFFRRGSSREITGVIVKGDQLLAPNARFRKARALRWAIKLETDSARKLILVERLNGLIGEAAYLEPRFKSWSQAVIDELTVLRRAANRFGYGGH